jgi:hypothetical protein
LEINSCFFFNCPSELTFWITYVHINKHAWLYTRALANTCTVTSMSKWKSTWKCSWEFWRKISWEN